MKRSDTQRRTRNTPGEFGKVFDSRNRRVRGLWIRNGVYYAQVRVQSWRGRVALEHAITVPEAVEEMQVLKAKIRKGQFVPSRRPIKGAQPDEKGAQQPPTKGAPDSPVKDCIAGYKYDRDRLRRKRLKTCKHENSSFNVWNAYAGDTPLSGVNARFLKNFAAYRMEIGDDESPEDGLSGRTVNLNVLALKHAISWAVVEGWLPEFPRDWAWKDLPETPKKVRLLEPAEVSFLAHATALDPEALALMDPRVRHLRAAQALTGQAFADYIFLLAYSGGRAEETILKRWSHVDWKRRVLHFPGALAKAGGGKPAEDRDVNFHSKLEVHLKAMFERRDTTSDYMFPGEVDGHVGSFRAQLETAREKLEAWHISNGMPEELAGEKCDSIGFHHFRHYFISHAVMAGIDFMTIALWVSHRDGGVLIGKKYGHLAPGHAAMQANKLSGAF